MLKKALLCSIVIASQVNASDNNSSQIEGVQYIKMLGKILKGNLQKEMKSDMSGLGAMHFCSQKANDLTKEVNSKLPKGTTVRRTALQYRSERNKPDAIDIKTMEKILSDMNASKTNLAKPFTVDTNNSMRIYKALFVEKKCLKCHGDKKSISADITKIIESKYPNDLATGFKEGDFRGVIVVKIKK